MTPAPTATAAATTTAPAASGTASAPADRFEAALDALRRQLLAPAHRQPGADGIHEATRRVAALLDGAAGWIGALDEAQRVRIGERIAQCLTDLSRVDARNRQALETLLGPRAAQLAAAPADWHGSDRARGPQLGHAGYPGGSR